jgi:hypothetical protein
MASWGENPPLVFLVEALVYGLGGGKKRAEPEALPGAAPPPPSAPGLLSAAERAEIIRTVRPNIPNIILDEAELARVNRERVVAAWKKANPGWENARV